MFEYWKWLYRHLRVFLKKWRLWVFLVVGIVIWVALGVATRALIGHPLQLVLATITIVYSIIMIVLILTYYCAYGAIDRDNRTSSY